MLVSVSKFKFIKSDVYVVNLSEVGLFAEDLIVFVVDKFLPILEKRALFVSLSGDLGAGKTTVTQNIAKVLGVVDVVTSPTFVIQKRYETGNKEITSLVHIDAYRLEGDNELEVLGFKKTMKVSKTLILMEWPEKVKDVSSFADIQLVFSVIDENLRQISVL
jgi:tRNA threonylcarbamoyladenosine biosynthesis protein TsaE